MAKPLISYIIPVGPNHDHLVDRAVRSIEKQAGVDPALCQIIVEPDPARRGPGHTRNKAVRRADGDLLVCLDADDVLLPTFTRRTLDLFARTGRYVYTDCITTDPVSGGKQGHYPMRDYDQDLIFQRHSLHVVTTLFPRVWHDAIGGFDPHLEYWEDCDYYLKAAWHGFCGIRIPEPLMVYHGETGRRREMSKSHIFRLRSEMSIRYGKGETKMCCGKSKPKASQPAPASEIENGVLVTFTRVGAKRFHGLASGYYYGYLSRGDQLKVYPADLEAEQYRKPQPMIAAVEAVVEIPQVERRALDETIQAIRARADQVLGRPA